MKGRIYFLLFTLVFFGFSVTLFSQGIQVRSEVSRKQLNLNDTFEFSIIIEGTQEPPTFQLPDLADFSVISGPSHSTNYQFINGKVYQSYTLTWVLAPLKTGKLSIPAFSIRINGQDYRTKPILVTVTGVPKPGKLNQRKSTSESSKEYVYLEARPSREECFVGQEILVDFTLYSRTAPRNFSITSMPDAVGFWVEEFPTPQNPQLQKKNIQGVSYYLATIKKIALFPTKPGELLLDRMNLITQIELKKTRRSRSWFDDFFNDPFFDSPFNTRLVNKNLISNPVHFKVLPLPEEGRPEDFTGAVGKFSLTVELDTNTVKQGEAFSYRIKVQGYGNTKLFNLSELRLPEELAEIYQPNVSQSNEVRNGHIFGVKSAEYVVIPREEGELSLPPYRFSYFDPEKKRYIKLTSQPLKVKVLPSNRVLTPSVSGYSRREIALLNSDIRYIKLKSNKWYRTNSSGRVEFIFWLEMILGVLMIGGAIGVKRFHEIYLKNEKWLRKRNAWTRARKSLEEMKKEIQSEKFKDLKLIADGCFDIITHYISDKVNARTLHPGVEEACNMLRKHAVDQELIQDVQNYLKRCEQIAFAPSTENPAIVKELIQECENLLLRIRRSL